MDRSISRRRRRQCLGLAAIAAVGALIAGAAAAYAGAFTPAVPATVISAQAGLLMTPGASVTLHGADVGTVTSVTAAGGQARLGISVDPARVPVIPANVPPSARRPPRAAASSSATPRPRPRPAPAARETARAPTTRPAACSTARTAPCTRSARPPCATARPP